MGKNLAILLFLAFGVLSCTHTKTKFIASDNPQIEYWGRMDKSVAGQTTLYWSGSSIKFNFEGESVKVLMQDETGDNYYNVIVDNDSVVLLRPDTVKQYYTLAKNLTDGSHTLEIFKRTEYDRGYTNFFGFELEGNAKLLAKPQAKKRKIEFYGNSITAGYGVEDTSGKDRPDSIFTNNYLSYAPITARHFDAEYRCICKSGIGITISWFPTIMPEIYNRINPQDSLSIWSFSLYQPDVVVVNLFQNDSWLVNMPGHASFKQQFGTIKPSEDFIINAYQQFVAKLRGHYPNAKIICMLGNMDATREGSVWPEYVRTAVASLQDENIYTHFVPYKESPGHPSIAEQQILANSLIRFMEENIKWD